MASAAPVPARDSKARNLTKLNHSPNVGRMAIVNHFNSKVAQLAPTTAFPRLKAFLPQNLLPWIGRYLRFALTPRFRFRDYTGSAKTGVYNVSPAPGSAGITIAIAGDWGTGTREAQSIAGLMSAGKPDFTIHLGDVYYVGDEEEIQENCLGRSSAQFQGVTWPLGTRGSFALNGNHEMYANGGPYFTTFLSRLGMAGDAEGQWASFFCLEAEHWRVIALDTGYNSVGIPILSQIPGINRIPFIGGDCHLEGSLLDWLRKNIKSAPKPALLLSHHQYFTAFEDKCYPRAAQQLMEFFKGQDVVWIWGHEHRLATYDRFSTSGGITAYGRCLGHGGMPVDVGTPDVAKAPLRFYDPRAEPLDGGPLVGRNGFLSVSIEGEALKLDYRDIDNLSLLVEEFRPAPGGALDCKIVSQAGVLQPPPA